MKLYKYHFIYILMLSGLLFTCNIPNNDNDPQHNTSAFQASDNVKISWAENCIQVSQLSNKRITITDYNKETDKYNLYVNDNRANKAGVLIRTDSAKRKTGAGNTTLNKYEITDTTRHPFTKLLATDYMLDSIEGNGYTYSSKKSVINTIDLKKINGNTIDFFNNDPVAITMDSCYFKKINIFSSYRHSDVDFQQTDKNILVSIRLTNDHRYPSANSVIIQNKIIGNIDPGNAGMVIIHNCSIAPNSFIDCYNADTLQLWNVSPANAHSTLYLSTLPHLTLNDLKVHPGPKTSHKTILRLTSTDAGCLDLDYQDFKYDPSGSYLKNLKNFGQIISIQKRNFNTQGVIAASIDSCIYEDNQHFLIPLFIPVKLWWNNYGYDKSKVLISSSELFLVFVILNFIFFNKLISQYEISEINKADKRSRKYGFFKRLLYKLFLCILYSGYLFYGLRFDFNRLKLNYIWLVFLVLLQYVCGVIAIAYLANLIISK